jgi:hypothetical protein
VETERGWEGAVSEPGVPSRVRTPDASKMQGQVLVAAGTNACCMVDRFGKRWNVTRRILDCWRKKPEQGLDAWGRKGKASKRAISAGLGIRWLTLSKRKLRTGGLRECVA